MSATETMSVYEKINKGHYKPSIEIAAIPRKPSILSTPVGILTDEQLATIPQVKADFEAAQKLYRESLAAYRKEESKATGEFYSDLCAEHEVPAEHPFIVTLYRIAREIGHDHLWDVTSAFDNLMPLWVVAKSNGMTVPTQDDRFYSRD